ASRRPAAGGRERPVGALGATGPLASVQCPVGAVVEGRPGRGRATSLATGQVTPNGATGRGEVGRSGCARRSATVRQFQPETLDSRTVAHDRGHSQQGETGMAFKRSWVRFPSAPLHHSLGLPEI